MLKKGLLSCLVGFFVLWFPIVCLGDVDYGVNPLAASLADDVLKAVQYNHHSQSGIGSNVGLNLGDGNIVLSGRGVDVNGTFRIGSQSKTFVGTAILSMMDKGWFALDDTLGELQARYNVDLGVAALPQGAESITVRRLLNMSSEIPNFMAGTRAGSSMTLWDEWKNVAYGEVVGVTHEELAALGLNLYPQAPVPPYEGSYSNTNAIILSLLGQAAYAERIGNAKSFAAILREMVFQPAGLSGTYLAGDAAPVSITGLESGKAITTMDPVIPWTSGAIVSTLRDQLNWIDVLQNNTYHLMSDELFQARTDLANSTLISMGGIPIYYGYNIFTMDFAGGFADFGVPLTAIGHGGSIAGYSSFSIWYQQLDLGLVVNVPRLSSIDRYGHFSATPSETLLMDQVRGLERLYRADGAVTASGVDTTISYGQNGGLFTLSPLALGEGQNLAIQASGRSTSYLDLFFLDVTGNPVVTTTDPTLTFYAAENTSGQAAVTLNGAAAKVDMGARAEAYGNRVAVFDVGAGGGLDLQGEAAAYGNEAAAIRVGKGGRLDMASGSRAYLQGGGGSTLSIAAGAGQVHVGGLVSALGGSSALSVDGSRVTVAESGVLHALSVGYAMAEDFTTVRPDTHAVYGAVLRNGAVLDLHGQAVAVAVNPWDGNPVAAGEYIADPGLMPGVLTAGLRMEGATANVYGEAWGDGYGAWLSSGDNVLNIAGGSLAGGLLAVKGGDGADNIAVYHGGSVTGSMDLGGGGDSLAVVHGGRVSGGTVDFGSGDDSLTVFKGTISGTFHLGNGNNRLYLDLDPSRVQEAFISAENLAITPVSGEVIGDSRVLLGPTFQVSGILSADNASYRPVTFSLQEEGGGKVILDTARDWAYYTDHVPNRSLGSTLDAMAGAAVGDVLSAGSESLILRLDMSTQPGSAALELQPHTLEGLGLAQIRQSSSRHRIIGRSDAPGARDDSTGRWVVFGGLHGHRGRQDGTGAKPDRYDLEGGGIMAGAPRTLGRRLQAGFFLDYSRETEDFRRSGKLTDDIFRFGPCARWTAGETELIATLSMGIHDIESKRKVSLLGETNHAGYEMHDYLATLFLAHPFHWRNLALVPYLEGAYLNQKNDSYREQGGVSALRVSGTRGEFLATTLGLDVSRPIPLGGTVLTPRLGVGWWHQYLDRSDKTKASFRGDPGFAFQTAALETDDDLLRLNAALHLNLRQGLFVNLDWEHFHSSSLRDSHLLAFSLGLTF